MVIQNYVEQHLDYISDKRLQITPRNRNWDKRIRLEIIQIHKYLKYLSDRGQDRWFQIAPNKDKTKHNYRVWEGKLKVTQRSDISFDIIIILSSKYPKIMPKAYIEKDVLKYSRNNNIFVNRKYPKEGTHKGKEYVQICHEHMEDNNYWTPELTIAHFLLREVLIWWNANISTIIKAWDHVI